jgi:hypothetical protein
MNRDQWTLKMKREEESLLKVGSAGIGAGGRSIFDRREGTRDRRVAGGDRRGSGNLQRLSTMMVNRASPAERYGACCEWGLPTRAQKR